MTEQLKVSSLDAAIVQAHSQLNQDLSKVVADSDFGDAIKKLDINLFSASFKTFSNELTAHNEFHRREVQLWSLKLRNGKLPGNVEDKFKSSVPTSIQHLEAAFQSVNLCLDHVEHCGLHRIVERYSDLFTRSYVFDETNPFGQLTMKYFRGVGFTDPMISDFKADHQEINCEFIRALGGGSYSKLRDIGQQGLQARISVLKHTQEHGFNYIRGGGPPAWAVTVSEVLASIGISIAAWVIVVIVAAIVALLLVLCITTKVLPNLVCVGLAALGFGFTF